MARPLLFLLLGLCAILLVVPFDTVGGDKKSTTQTMYKVPLNVTDWQSSFGAIKEEFPKIRAAMDSGPLKVVEPVLGEPIACVWVRLDHLKENRFTGDLFSFSESKPKKAIYPVCSMKDNKAVYSIEAQFKKEKWRVTAFGGSAGAKLLFGVRDAHSRRNKISPSSYFVFAVPALSCDFLALAKHDRPALLIPVLDDPDAGFFAGREMDAQQAIRKLQEMASKVEVKEKR